MLGVLLVYGLMWGGLFVVLFVGTIWFQETIYTEAVAGVGWRSALTATALALFLAFWGWVDFRDPGRYGALFDFSASDRKEFRDLVAVTRKDGREVRERYRMQKNPLGRPEYRRVDPPYGPLPGRPDAVVVREDDQEVRFEAERDPNNKFRVREGQSLRYVDSRGRSMTADSLGQLSTFRVGPLVVYAGLNLLHLAIWFGLLWLLLRFQWPHALGLGVAAWLIVTLGVIPPLMRRVDALAAPAGAPAVAAAEPATRCA